MEAFAWLAVGVGLLFGLFFLYQTKSLCLSCNFDLNKAKEVATVLSGSVGVLWLLASVFLFKSSLDIQRVEIKTTNVTLIKQQFESTIFNLVKTKNELVGGLFDETTSIAKSLFSKYDLVKKHDYKNQSAEWEDVNKRGLWTRVKIYEELYLKLEINKVKQFYLTIIDFFKEKEREGVGSEFCTFS